MFPLPARVCVPWKIHCVTWPFGDPDTVIDPLLSIPFETFSVPAKGTVSETPDDTVTPFSVGFTSENDEEPLDANVPPTTVPCRLIVAA